jgi:enterochelin esterase family protein
MVEVPGTPPLLHEQQPVAHGVVHHHIYQSKSADHERGVYVYTPPGYDPRRQAGYPLLILLHGFGDDESAWLEVGRANLIADNLIAADTIPPLVIAMPYGHPLPIECPRTFVDDYAVRNINALDNDLQQDLVPFLERTYHLSDSRSERAVAGLSMGGGQALTIGLRRLDEFAWIGGFSAATPQGDLDQQLAGLTEDIQETNESIKLLWIGCGSDDFLYDRNEAFRAWLVRKGIDHTCRFTAGGHDWTVWRYYLAEFLPLLFHENGDNR